MDYLIHAILSLPLIGAYAMFAVGIVVIYRASRVLNLAHGAMAMVPAYIVFSLVEAGIPVLVAFVLGVASGAIIGLLVERIFIRGLRHMSLTAQTVGTVAVLAFLIAITAKIWGTAPRSAPSIFPSGFISVGAGRLLYGAIGLFGVAVVAAVVMLAIFKYTNLGLAMRGSAENRRAASLMGINPDRTTAIAWALGGSLAALSGILLAAITTLSPYDLPLQTLPAFVAALLGGIGSVTGALGGSAVVGLILGLVPATSDLPIIGLVTAETGGPELALTITALAVMFFRGQRFSVAVREGGEFAAAKGRAPKTLRRPGMPVPLLLLLLAALIGWVWIPGIQFSLLANVSQAMIYTVVGISLVVLTGWVGQISLGHAALVGIGAFGTGVLARNLGVPFPFNLPLAAAMAAGAAVLLGAVALRVRGLYLAVATLIFSWMADSFLFRSSWFVGAGGTSTVENVTFGSIQGFPHFDLSDRKILYYFGLAVTVVGLLVAANLRSSKTGRAFFALRGSEMAAASLGIDVMRYKLLAFGISGMLAGAAGNLIMIDQRTIVPDQFRFTVSLFYLSIVVVGGLVSLSGVLFASMLFAGLNEAFTQVTALQGNLEVVSAGLLVAAILAQAHNAKIVAAGEFLRRAAGPLGGLLRNVGGMILRLLRGLTRPVLAPFGRLGVRIRESRKEKPLRPAPTAKRPSRLSGALSRLAFWRKAPQTGRFDLIEPSPNGETPERRDTKLVLEGRGITVQFGGLTAVSDASIEIREGEIVGLIGPNGAGKTTLFNALSGLNQPTGGVVRLFGNDVSPLPVHERARLGMGRTFQVLQLFSDLTVRENLLVATHVHNHTGFVRHILATDGSVAAERDCHERVNEVLGILELNEIADRPVAGLPFGILRLVELGRAVITDAPIILLDEAASGLDNTETDRFTDFLKSLRKRMGISMLLIEHDVRMVMGVSDYIYVLNMGQMISEGPPERVQNDPQVIAAYLGEPAEPEKVGV